MSQKPTVYDTGKVKIGLHYRPDTRPKLSKLEERLQAALLDVKGNAIEEFLDEHPRLAPYLIFAVIVAALSFVSYIS